MQPIQAHGISTNSMGFLVHEAAVWRGPMASQALQQLILQTNWQNLDFLIVDMPPGTGDISLTLAQKVPISGCVIVTTPQNIATMDADKCINMAHKLNLDILGVVENMSVHICPNCEHTSHIFGQEGGKILAEKYQIDVIGQLPLLLDIAKSADLGDPFVFTNHPAAEKYHELAAHVTQKIAAKKRDRSYLFDLKTV
jgi:ATP-binding protein involved in chromosome partitioning